MESWKLSLDHPPRHVKKFVAEFMENLESQFSSNPHGMTQVVVCDSSQPMMGFSSLGFDGWEQLQSKTSSEHGFNNLSDGDIVVFQARDHGPVGGGTKLGLLRSQLWLSAISSGLIEKEVLKQLRFVWITGFPMFTPSDLTSDPGQRGSAGFSATHHPFTAPASVEDYELMFTDPLRAKADHYDLVLNGTELGGGSRRIHVAEVQETVMRDVLKMGDESIHEFSHLLDALRAGCPPHAGFALGFDRFVAVLSGTNSIRNVIAFPKGKKGEDIFAKSPAKMTKEQLETYHLKIVA